MAAGGESMAAKSLSRRRQIATGLLLAAAGFALAALAASHLGGSPGRLDPVVGLIGGAALVFLGAILVAPERRRRVRAWGGALMITSIALLFDWLVLGHAPPGARTHFWEAPGKVLLASGALLFSLMAMWAWMRAL